MNRFDPSGLEWCGPNGTIWCDSITVTASGGSVTTVPGWNPAGLLGGGGGGTMGSDACANGFATLGYIPDYLAACVLTAASSRRSHRSNY